MPTLLDKSIEARKDAVLARAIVEKIEDFGSLEIDRVFGGCVAADVCKVVMISMIGMGLTIDILYGLETEPKFISYDVLTKMERDDRAAYMIALNKIYFDDWRRLERVFDAAWSRAFDTASAQGCVGAALANTAQQAGNKALALELGAEGECNWNASDRKRLIYEKSISSLNGYRLYSITFRDASMNKYQWLRYDVSEADALTMAEIDAKRHYGEGVTCIEATPTTLPAAFPGVILPTYYRMVKVIDGNDGLVGYLRSDIPILLVDWQQRATEADDMLPMMDDQTSATYEGSTKAMKELHEEIVRPTMSGDTLNIIRCAWVAEFIDHALPEITILPTYVLNWTGPVGTVSIS